MIDLVGVSKYYTNSSGVSIGIKDVSISMSIGEFVVITGESGSGKSTLLSIISGQNYYDDGELLIDGLHTSSFFKNQWDEYKRKYIGYVSQKFEIIDSYSVYQNIELSLTIEGVRKKDRKNRINSIIDKVGLTKQKHQKAAKLSGGQKQRCVIASVLLRDCPIILCDEPTGNLDSKSSEIILKMLYEISKEKLVIVVTHNYAEISCFASRRIRMFDGKIVEDSNIKQTYSTKSSFTLSECTFRINFIDYFKIAKMNLLSVYKKTIFSMIVILLLLFSMSTIYGISKSYEKSYADNETYSTFHITNEYPGRIMVSKYNFEIFTEEEINTINELQCDSLVNSNCIEYIERNDFILDRNFLTSDISSVSEYYNILPLEIVDSKNLILGRMPSNSNEVLISGFSQNVLTLRDDFSIFSELNDVDNPKTYNVVGILDISIKDNFVYVSQDFFYDLKDSIIDNSSSIYTLVEGDSSIVNESLKTSEMNFIYEDSNSTYNNSFNGSVFSDEQLSDSTIIISENLYESFECEPEKFSINHTFKESILSTTIYNQSEDFTNIVIESSSNDQIRISSNVYYSLFSWGDTQLSVFVNSNSNHNDIVSDLKALGYNTFVPGDDLNYSLEDDNQNISTYLTRFFIVILLIALIYFSAYVIIKNTMKSKKNIYCIYKINGIHKKSIYFIIFLELLIQFLLSFIFVAIMYFVNEYLLYRPFLPMVIKYYNIKTFIIFTFIILSMILNLTVQLTKDILSSSIIKNMDNE